MADSRLPDVVPAADVHLPIPTAVTLDSVSNTLIRIWPEEKEGKEEKEEEGEVQHAQNSINFVSSDSGIDSLLSSPIDDPKALTERIQPTELCGGTHLKVPKTVKCNSVNSVAEVHPHPNTVCQDDGSFNSNDWAVGSHSADKTASLPHNKMDKFSPKKREVSGSPLIFIQQHGPADTSSLEESFSISLQEADPACNTTSNSHWTGSDPEGSSFLHNPFNSDEGSVSRFGSFCSISSECGVAGSPAVELSRSSSRATFLSVPSTRLQPRHQRRCRMNSNPDVHPLHTDSIASLAQSVSSIIRSHHRLADESVEVSANDVVDSSDVEASTMAFIDSNNAVCNNNVLSLTQRLAFPERPSTSDYRLTSKNYIETESNFDFFAKIVTLLVLVFVIVLITGVLVKRYHTPK